MQDVSTNIIAAIVVLKKDPAPFKKLDLFYLNPSILPRL